jgi:hypothetical protein
MGLVILLALTGLLYYVYLDSQKRGVNPALWVGVCFIFPLVGHLIYFLKRPITNKTPNKAPFGFRSKQKWKMAIAVIAYLLFFAVSATAALSDGQPYKPASTVADTKSTTTPSTTAQADTTTQFTPREQQRHTRLLLQ